MKELKELYELEEVAPLTGFDNGMVVYHRSTCPGRKEARPRGLLLYSERRNERRILRGGTRGRRR
jgi:hypothetical protein